MEFFSFVGDTGRLKGARVKWDSLLPVVVSLYYTKAFYCRVGAGTRNSTSMRILEVVEYSSKGSKGYLSWILRSILREPAGIPGGKVWPTPTSAHDSWPQLTTSTPAHDFDLQKFLTLTVVHTQRPAIHQNYQVSVLAHLRHPAVSAPGIRCCIMMVMSIPAGFGEVAFWPQFS